MISIPAASPFQSNLLSSQLANSLSSSALSANALSANALSTSALSSSSSNSETQSFASYLKESGNAEDETRSTTESTVLKKSATKHTKEPRQNKPAASGASLTATGVIAQANDPRSILLSLQQSRNGDGGSTGGGKTGGGIVAGAAAKTEAPMESGPATQKGQLAFSVTLPKTDAQETDAPAGKPSGTGADSAAGIATVDKASLDNKSSAGGGHSDASDSNDPSSSSKAPAASDNTTNTAAFAPVSGSAGSTTGLAIQMAPGQTSPYSGSNSGKMASLPSAAEVMGAADLPPKPVSRPPQSIDLKVEGTDNKEGVDVRISQRAGDVQVTVRTPDNQLADSLRQHLPELSDRLAQNGVEGEIWHPGAAQASADTTSNRESWTSDQSQGQQQQQRSPDGKPRQPRENENGQPD